MPLAAGTRLGPYEIVAPIGAGGMGEVYKARDTRLDRTVAVKVSNQRFTERFEREARAIAALNHPNICALYDVGPDYLVMEYIDGTPLKGPLPVEKALPLALQIAAALGEAHGKGIVHRDLKPGNILVTAAAGVKLLDFGLAKMEMPVTPSDLTATATQVGTVLGTAAYMSPEQAEGQTVDARSDIFAFGLVLYEMLSGEQAFVGKSLLSTAAAILHQEPRPLDAPPPVTQIVSRCLRKAPADRFQTTAELQLALEEAAAGKSAAPEPSIAVLPFANLSADKENEYFSDGLAEEIINALTKMPGLKVTARTSAFFFRGKDMKLADIARELGVAHVLEGSVRKAGNRIRVTAQLIKAADGFHLWSERYDRELTDVFAIQDEIASAIVNQLQVNLTGGTAPAPKRPAHVAAYEAVLEGRHNFEKMTPSNSARALECFERAIAIDRSYAAGHEGLANYYIGLAAMGLADSRRVLPLARAAAVRAAELAPADPEIPSLLALIDILLDYSWAGAEPRFRRALGANPQSPARFPFAFWYLRPLGRLEEALAELQRVLEHDPLSTNSRFARAAVLMSMGSYAAAEGEARRALEIDPTYSLGFLMLSNALALQGRHPEALLQAERLVQLHGRWPLTVGSLGIAHAMAGHRAEPLQSAEELRAMSERSSVAAFGLAALYAQLGELDLAFEWVGKAIEQREPGALSFKYHPLFASLRSDARHPALLRKMNLA